MARINNLTNFLTDVASAIKTKIGDSTAIPASQFDTKIAGITTGHLDNTEYAEANDDLDDILENTTVPSGTISITQNGIFDVTNYTSANVSIDNNAKIETLLEGSKNTFLKNTIIELPVLNFINTSIDGSSLFANWINLKKINGFINSNFTSLSQTFAGCGELTDVPIFDTSNVTNMASAFTNCYSLTNESLNNIMTMCINATSYAGTKTLSTLGITQAQATICQGLSNYSDFVTAGWTTGY